MSAPEVAARSTARISSRAGRYAAALAFVGAATLARGALQPIIGGQAPFALFAIAVMAAAWTAGFDGGVLATLVSAAVASLLYVEPRLSLRLGTSSAGLFLFVAQGLFIAWLTSRWRLTDLLLRDGQQALQAHAAELEFQGTLLRQAYDAIFVRDEHARITLWNGGAERVYGWSAAEAVGRNAHDLLGTPAAIVAEFRSALARGPWSGQIHHRHRDGRTVISDSRQVRLPSGHVLEVNRDISDQVRAEAQRIASEQTMKALMDASTESIWLLDRERVLVANATAAERLGLTVEQLTGTPWRTLFPGDVAARRGEKVEEVFATGAPVRFEDERNGILFDHTFYPARDATGAVVAVAAFSRDVTGQRRIEAELRERAQELVRANRLKDDFLATLSHELRTPINAILGWAQILTMADFSEERLARGIDTITRNARLQARMVEDLLDISRIVTGSVRLDLQAVELGAVIDQALDGIRPAAEAKRLAVYADIDRDAGVTADPTRLQQVLWNLLSNAVKFTPPGGQVSLTARREGGDVRITVADSGVGIAPAFLPHVFERFRQADSSPTREHGGLGLGLAIVRHIIELHGGTVDARSDGPGHGAEFTVRLPARSAVAPRAEPHARLADGRGCPLAGTRVLVVDDEPDARDMLETLLSAAGAHVCAAASAPEALAELQRFAPDVVVSDVAMPGMDGYAFVREPRRLPRVSHLRCIALTAYGGPEAHARAIDAGFDEHLAKPAEADALLAAIGRILAR
ncbi:MAG: ATP-binding protein [Vicinamibacterales bacterium]